MYTEAERMEALQTLAENSGNLKQTAKETGISRNALTVWRRKYGKEYIEFKEERQEAHIEKIFDVREKALKVMDMKLPEASAVGAAAIYDRLTMKELLLRGELVEKHRVDINIEATIDIRAITERTKERHQLLDELSSRGSRGLNSLPVSTGPDGTPEAFDDRNRDTKRFVHHEQGKPETVIVAEPDTVKTVPGD